MKRAALYALTTWAVSIFSIVVSNVTRHSEPTESVIECTRWLCISICL
jgi:hypothetical protein